MSSPYQHQLIQSPSSSVSWPRRYPRDRQCVWAYQHQPSPRHWHFSYRCLWKSTPPEKNTIRKLGFCSTKSGCWIAVSAEGLQDEGSPKRSCFSQQTPVASRVSSVSVRRSSRSPSAGCGCTGLSGTRHVYIYIYIYIYIYTYIHIYIYI